MFQVCLQPGHGIPQYRVAYSLLTVLFQRIRGAIDRTIAEEQARQKPGDSATPTRSGSSSSRRSDANAADRHPRAKKPSADVADNAAPSPDPAVFEAAFVIDDSDDPSRAGTPGPPPAPPEKDDSDSSGPAAKIKDGQVEFSQDGMGKKLEADGATASTNSGETTNATGLSPEIKQRLKKLEKLEATYPGTMRRSVFIRRNPVLTRPSRTLTIIPSRS